MLQNAEKSLTFTLNVPFGEKREVLTAAQDLYDRINVAVFVIRGCQS
jgi:hypothetical protein